MLRYVKNSGNVYYIFRCYKSFGQLRNGNKKYSSRLKFGNTAGHIMETFFTCLLI